MTESKSWLVSAKTAVSLASSILGILVSIIIACAWCVGRYQDLADRVGKVEIQEQYTQETLKEIKSMLSQLMLNSVQNRPDTQRWTR